MEKAMKREEIIYLSYRKCKAFGNMILFYIFRIFPIKKNKIVFCSIEGQCGYSCNPKYVAEELLKDNKGYEIYWLVNDINKKFPKEIKKVKNTIWNRIYHLSTADIWVDNSRKPLGTRKRKGQLYIQTWHATLAFKPAGKMRNAFPKIAYWVSKNDSNLADYVLTDSEWCDRLYPDLLFTNGNTLRIGAPRCDVLVDNEKKESKYLELRRKFGLPVDSKIVMHAPTFRGGSQTVVREVFAEKISIDYKRLQKTLEKNWGGTWYVFIRLHPQIACQMNSTNSISDEKIYDVSKEDDMNEIMAGVDIFISDYSSAAFDASFAKIPVFIYADDIEEFTEDRGQFLWKKGELPFAISKNNDELEKNIVCFEREKYEADLNILFKKVELTEDGTASQRVKKIIDEHMGVS